ncbi:MAG: ABC transporter ATP-binding protein [Burkholderiaceae bacterium]|nr:ABC transporter ATP-binding protein [Burkholderiaceae bacterium]
MLRSFDAAVELREVSKLYAQSVAVDSISFTVKPGEFFAMLGPSGSGKTTCLRLIAGFERPSAGAVLMNGLDMTSVPPYERDVNTVFQDYALFPHLSVIENVAYGMRMNGVAAGERRRRALEALEQVALAGYEERRPSQLSGGQRQRVALARAIVNRPKLLLLDEPLGALDLRLREQMQGELKRLHRELGISFVYVTHDQGEAMAMADRVAVFSKGRLEQVDSPRQLYQRPGTAFVAEFVGGSNVLRDDLARDMSKGASSLLSIRPEYVRVQSLSDAVPDDCVGAEGVVSEMLFHGASTRCEVALGQTLVSATLASGLLDSAATTISPGSAVRLVWPARAMVELAA